MEALRRIGVTVRGVLGSSPERGRARADALGVRVAYPSLDDLLADDTVDVVHVTSPNDVHVEQSLAILRAGKHVVCEKPLAMTAEDSARLVAAAADSGLVNATNFNIRYYPLNQHAHELVAGGGLGEVRLVTGRYFQDWLLHDTDWNWRLAAGTRRSAARGRRHRFPLARPDDLRDRSARRRSHGRSVDVHRDAPRTSRTGRVVRDGAVDGHRRPRPISTEDTASILLRFDGGARGAVNVSQISAGRKNSLQYEIDGSESRLGVGFRAAGPGVDRPPGCCQRDPDPEPRAARRGRSGGRRSPRRSRRGLLRHVLRPLPSDLRRRGRRRAVVRSRPTRPSPTATTRCSSNDAIAASARLGRWVDVVRGPRVARQ